MRAILIIILFAIFVLASSLVVEAVNEADRQQTRIEVIEVADRRVYCDGLVPGKCMQVKRENSKEFRIFRDRIENFEFIPGFNYVLKVEVERQKVIPKDTSGYKYYLKEIISREFVSNPDPFSDLYLNKWTLLRMNGEEIEGRKPFLVFTKHNSGFYGFGGCNSLGGKFSLTTDEFSTSRLRQSKRACPNMNEVEFPFTSSLSSIDKIEVEIDRLYMYQNGRLVLEFEAE